MACRNSRSAGSTEAAAAICFRADSSRQPILPNSLLRHFVDVIAEKDGKRFLVSLKWQQLSGTAEQKVPFEVISLADAVTKDGFTKAYLVLGGEGWTLRAFYTEADLQAISSALTKFQRALCCVRESRETLSSAARLRYEK